MLDEERPASADPAAWLSWTSQKQATASDPGRYSIAGRATDNTGAVQTAELADPVPDGASGWHTVSFDVT